MADIKNQATYLCIQWMSPIPGKQIKIKNDYVIDVIPMNNEFFGLCITFANLYNLYCSRIQQILNKFMTIQHNTYNKEIIFVQNLLRILKNCNIYVINKYSTYTNEPMEIIESISNMKEIVVYLQKYIIPQYIILYNSVY